MFIIIGKKINVPLCQQNNYDMNFVNEVYQSKIIDFEELKSGSIIDRVPGRIPYDSRLSYKSKAKMLGLMDDFKVI